MTRTPAVLVLVLTQAQAQALRLDQDQDLDPQDPAKEEALAMEVPTATAVEGLEAEVPRVMIPDPKVVMVMAHLEMDHRDQALETPLATAADLAMTTMMLLATDHHQAQVQEEPLAMEEADQVTMRTAPQTTVAQATQAAQAEVLAATKAEAAQDPLVPLRTPEALPMAAQATTMTR